MPGGWGDIGATLAEVAVKEVKEETGLDVKPNKLLAILDKRCHPNPPQADYVYKFFIHCELMPSNFIDLFDILDKVFFVKDAIHTLSLNRVLPSQINLMYEYLNNPLEDTLIDWSQKASSSYAL